MSGAEGVVGEQNLGSVATLEPVTKSITSPDSAGPPKSKPKTDGAPDTTPKPPPPAEHVIDQPTPDTAADVDRDTTERSMPEAEQTGEVLLSAGQIDSLGMISMAVIVREARKNGIVEKAKTTPAALTDAESALLLASSLASGEFLQQEKKGEKPKAVPQDAAGNYNDGRGFVLPSGGQALLLQENVGPYEAGRFRFSRIIRGRQEDGKQVYDCTVRRAGTGINDEPQTITVAAQDLVALQVATESGSFRSIDNPALRTFIDAASGTPPTPDTLDGILVEGANQAGLVTTSALAEELLHKFPKADEQPQAVTRLLAELADPDHVLATENQFLATMEQLGVGKTSFTNNIDQLLEESQQEGITDARKKEIEQQIKILRKLEIAWDKAVDDKKDPMRVCFEATQKGTLDFDTLVQAANGKPDKFIAFLGQNPDIQLYKNLSAEDQNQILDWLNKNKGKIGKGLLWTVIALMAGGILSGVAVGIVGMNAVKSAQ